MVTFRVTVSEIRVVSFDSLCFLNRAIMLGESYTVKNRQAPGGPRLALLE